MATFNFSLDRFVLPALGHLRLRDIRRGHVKDTLIGMRAKGYADDTIRLARAALSSVLNAAVDDEIIDLNVTHRLGLKLRKGKPTASGPSCGARMPDRRCMAPATKPLAVKASASSRDRAQCVE
jgi:hypothetical protein